MIIEALVILAGKLLKRPRYNHCLENSLPDLKTLTIGRTTEAWDPCHRGSLYLVGWSPDHQEIRHWMVDRIEESHLEEL